MWLPRRFLHPSHNILVVSSQRNLFRSAMSLANYQRTRLAWVHKPIANRGGHSKIFCSCGQIWIENCSHPASDRRKTQGNLWITAQIKHWGGLWSFWKPIAGGQERWNFLSRLTIYDDEKLFSEAGSHLKSKSTSPIVFQIHFQNSISLSEIAQTGWHRTLRGRCNYLNIWGQRDRSEMILQSKIQNNSSFRSRKTILTGGCRSENHSPTCHSPVINRSLKLILIWHFPFLM